MRHSPMAHKSLCRLIRNGPMKISKSLKKAENGPFGRNLFPVTVLVVFLARYSKGWIKGGAKIGRGRASPLTKSSFRPNVHSNILMYC